MKAHGHKALLWYCHGPGYQRAADLETIWILEGVESKCRLGWPRRWWLLVLLVGLQEY